MSVLSIPSSACSCGCRCIPGLCSWSCRGWISVVPAVVPLAHVALAACTALVPWPSALLLTAYRRSIVPLGGFSCVHWLWFRSDNGKSHLWAITEVKNREKQNQTHFHYFFKNPKQRAHYFLFKTTKFSRKTHLTHMWYGRCWYPLPTAVTYTHSCTANCLPSNELAQISALLHMLGFAGCISASLLFILQKPFSVPAVIFRNWQVGFCKLIKFILNMDVTLHQKTMKRQEIRSRTQPSLCQIWFVSTVRF